MYVYKCVYVCVGRGHGGGGVKPTDVQYINAHGAYIYRERDGYI